MKKLAIAAVLLMGGWASGAMAQTYNITVKGFCDTFTLTIDGPRIYGSHNDCSTTLVDGGANAKVKGKDYLFVNDTVDGSEIYSYYFTPPNAENKGRLYLYEETTSGVTRLFDGVLVYYTTSDDAVAPAGNKMLLARQ